MKKILAIMLIMCMITACTPTEPVINDEPVIETENMKLMNKTEEVKNLDKYELLGHRRN